MSKGLFGGLFSSKKKEAAPTPDEALQKLHDTEEMLTKKQEYLETRITAELATARSHGTKNKRMALQALKRKKAHEKTLEQVDGVLNTICYQRSSLENALMNADVFQVIQGASKAMGNAQKKMGVDDIYAALDEIDEQRQLSDEIEKAMIMPSSEYDDQDLLEELEEMEEAEKEEQRTAVKEPKFPALPSHDLPSSASKKTAKQQKEDEDELAELAGWAAA